MKTMQPTAEQLAVIDAAKTGDHLIVQAGAGTGKTSTLVLTGEALPKRGLYVAYNKATATDAAERFPYWVTCKTSHSLAFGAVGRQFSHRLNSARQPSWEVAKTMNIKWLNMDKVAVSPNHQARITADTVRRFCYSADVSITAHHVPLQNGIRGAAHTGLTQAILPLAQRLWDDICSTEGELPFEHDHYLKMWALSSPRLDTEVVMLDEAQDSNPVIAELIRNQTHAQQIITGDSSQQMYSWRGAVDALGSWKDATELYLTQSWRFGEVIAQEANKWLSQLPTPLVLSGNPDIESELTTLAHPRAVLCRTNAGAMAVVLEQLAADTSVALVGGGQVLSRLAKAAEDLMAGKRTSHPELYAFPDWDAVRAYAKDESVGADLRPLVKLIDTHGTEAIIAATRALSDENSAAVVVSTAHKAKGREWDSVRIADDFFAYDPEERDIPAGEAMVGYVAVSRARYQLDRSGLAWIDDYCDLPEKDLDPLP